MNENYFCVRHENSRKHNQHFELLLFTTNLHFVTSSQISIYRKLNLLLISNIYLLFLPLEMQRKTQTDQSILHVNLLCLKGNELQNFKNSS